MRWNFWKRKKKYEIYTDGTWKQGRGAWAYIVVERGLVQREVSGSVKKTNSHRMEFQAAINALESLEQGSQVIIYSDSRVLIDTMTFWVADWKKLGWKKKNGRPIPGVDQIQILEILSQRHLISWKWIKAHSGLVFNERCDELCILARSKVIDDFKPKPI